MASFFQLELDTTAPSISIEAPWYTVPRQYIQFAIKAEGPLDIWQDVYIVDSAGVKHQVICSMTATGLEGIVDVRSFSSGTATIYARVRDDVHNTSALASRSFNIWTAAEIFLEVEATTFTIRPSENINDLSLGEFAGALRIGAVETVMNVSAVEQILKVEVNASEYLPTR